MARQIGYGALTVTDVTDGINNATIYLYHRYPDTSDNDIAQGTTGHELPLNNALEYNFTTGRLSSIHGDNDDFRGWTQTIPSGTDAIYVTTAVATSVENTYIIPSWSTAVKLATNGANGVDGTDGLSVKAVRELYYFKRTTDSNPQDLSQITPTPTIYTDTEPGHWTSKTPSYLAGGTYYTCIETTLSNNTKAYSSPAVNEALTDANNNAAIAKSIAQANEENAQGALAISQGLESRLRYIWVNLNEPSLPSDDTNTNVYLGGTYAASGINGTTFVSSNPSTYGFNSLLRHTKLMFRYNGIALTTIGLDGLKLFAPLITNNVITGHQLSIELTGGSAGVLNFYNPKTGKVGLSLNKDNITFYKHDSTTAAATLNGTGLNIAAGSIKLGDYFEATSDGTITAKRGTIGGWSIGSNDLYTGTWGTNGSAMLCTGTSGSKSIGGSDSINNWVFTAGANFGVTKSGALYATSAKIDGDITARSLKIGNDSTSITTSAILNVNVQPQNLSEGTMLYKDPMFIYGTNSTNLYDNNKSGKTTWTRATKSSDNPMNKTSYEMVCKNTGTGPSPGLGGFYWAHPTRANAVFLYRIIAKIPTGHNLNFHTNATGDNRTMIWLTPNAGTGKFTEYIFKLGCGTSGTFSTSGFFAIDGTASVTWYVAYAAVFDMTGKAEVNNYITNVDTNGIWITPADKAPTNTSTGAGATGTKIDGSGVGIYIGGIRVAQYGSTTTFYTSDGKTTAATLDGTGLNIKTGTITLGSNNFVATNTGAVTAKNITVAGGTIGGFTITSTSNTGTSANGGHAYTTSLYAHSGDGTYEYEVGMKGDGNNTTGDSGNVAFYVRRITKGGAWSSAAYPFYVTKGGTLYTEKANITGSIVATSFDAKDSTGIRAKVDSNGLTIYDGSGTGSANIQARFGSTIQIGKTNSGYMTLSSNGANIFSDSGKDKIELGSGAIKFTKNSIYIGSLRYTYYEQDSNVYGLSLFLDRATTTARPGYVGLSAKNSSGTNVMRLVYVQDNATISGYTSGAINVGCILDMNTYDIKDAGKIYASQFFPGRNSSYYIGYNTNGDITINTRLMINTTSHYVTTLYVNGTAYINGYADFNGDATAFGLLKSTKNSNTVTIGSQNSSWCHIYNSADIPFIFNKTVATTSGDLGTTSYKWKNLYMSGAANVGSVVSSGQVTGNTFRRTATTTSTSATANVRITSDGSILPVSGWTSSSIRYKKNVGKIQEVDLDPKHLYDIDVVQFKYKTDHLSNPEDIRYDRFLPGFIAEQVYEVYPVAVDIEDGQVETWSERYIIPPMLKLIQEQHEEIEQLKKEVTELKNK